MSKRRSEERGDLPGQAQTKHRLAIDLKDTKALGINNRTDADPVCLLKRHKVRCGQVGCEPETANLGSNQVL